MKPLFTAALVMGCLLTAGVVLADDDPAGKGKGKNKSKALDLEQVFKKLDENNDGKLSLEEFQKNELMQKVKAKRAEAPESIFKKLDENKDGFLSLDEFRKISEFRGKKKDK